MAQGWPRSHSRPPATAAARVRRHLTGLNGAWLTCIGRSGEALLESLDDNVQLAEGPGATCTSVHALFAAGRSSSSLSRRCAVPGGDRRSVSRLRRRHIPLRRREELSDSRSFCSSPASVRAVLVPRGVEDPRGPTARARALARDAVPGAGLAAYGCLLALGWLVGRDRLVPRRPLGDGEELTGQVGALLVLAVLSLLIVAMNPYAVIFVLPSLHAWIWLPQARNRSAPIQLAALVGGFLGPLLLVGSLATRLGLGLDAPWYLAQLAAVGYVKLPTLLVGGAWLAVAAQLTAITVRRYAPYPSAAERPRLGPARRLMRRAVLSSRSRKRPHEQEQRAVGP